jgi:hypothetical protein
VEIPAEQLAFGDVIDGLVCHDFTARGVVAPLYDAQRERVGAPLILHAARLLTERVSRGARVILATGWPSRSWLMQGLTETDGPVGAAYLARVLEQATGCVPLLLMDRRLHAVGAAVLRRAGLILADLPTALRSKEGRHTAAVSALLDFTTYWEVADAEAESLLETLQPAALIAVEFPGASLAREFHNTTGRLVPSALVPKVDTLFARARERGALTIGIGDGGNELGMGNIRCAIERMAPAQAPAVPATEVDALIVACISNWGAFGLGATIAYLCQQPDLPRTPDICAITAAASEQGAIDGLSAYVDPRNDGTSQATNAALQELLAATVRLHHAGWIKG